MEHAFFPKGSYIFKQGENNKRFYGVIRGKISIRIKKPMRAIANAFINANAGDTYIYKSTFGSDKNVKYDKFNSPISSTFCESPINKKTIKKFQSSLVGSGKFLKIPASIITDLPNEFDLEDEKTQMNEGMCFGEWALIYNIPRTASAYALEDTDLFYIDKEFFDITFSKCITHADTKKKTFVTQKIPSLKSAGKVQDILKKLIPVVRAII
jgi:CRP-like cAMP-binding protein